MGIGLSARNRSPDTGWGIAAQRRHETPRLVWVKMIETKIEHKSSAVLPFASGNRTLRHLRFVPTASLCITEKLRC
jgi:hypothetical protein